MILTHAPHDSPWARALSGCGHTAAEHMYVAQLHVAQVANWQRGGGKKSTQPKLPDCMLPKADAEVTRYSARPVEIEQMASMLGWDTLPTPAFPTST